MNLRPYHYPYYQKAELEKQVKEMMDLGIIMPSQSSYASPALLVGKKDGTLPMCIDCRWLNSMIVIDKFLIPIVDDLLNELNGATIFTKLDLRSDHHHIKMHEADFDKTTFRTHHRNYKFLVMTFGLTTAPVTFQSLMNTILADFLKRFVLVFFDNILIYNRTIEDHLQHMHSIFQRLRENNLLIKESKCSFGQKQVEYLGCIIYLKKG